MKKLSCSEITSSFVSHFLLVITLVAQTVAIAPITIFLNQQKRDHDDLDFFVSVCAPASLTIPKFLVVLRYV